MKTNINIFNALNESLEEEFERKRNHKKYSVKNRKLNEADKVEIDKDGNKSIRDTKTGHLKKITVSKKTQDKMADEYNRKLDESSGDRYEVWQRYYDDEFNRNGEYVQSFDNYEQAAKFVAGLTRDSNCEAWIVDKFEESSLNETGEWDDNDEEMSAWLEDLRGQAQELADEISGEVKSVTGFDAYQGPRAVVHSPKHGDVIVWFDSEDDTGRSFNVKVAHVGWISGGIKQLADLLNQDKIPENEIINESLINEAERIDPNNLTKEQLWNLRKEIVLGSIYINDYKNSLNINPQAVCNFFDSFIEDAQQDDEGNFNNRKTEDFDNAEELYNYYFSCENPFGDLTESKINESEDNDFYNYVKGLLDAGAIDDPNYYNSLSDKEKEDLIRNTWMKDGEIIKQFKDIKKDLNEDDIEFYKNKYKNTFDRWKKSNPQASDKEIVDIIKAKQYNGELNEEDVIKVNDVEIEPDYIIQDVTVLDQVGDGDVQSPDIEAMLTLVDSALKENYSKEWGHIKTLSSKIDENTSYALVDISTPEVLKEFESKGIKDAAIGKNLILEKVNDKLVEFKVNNLNGTTKYSKKTSNPQKTIYEWIETEFLQEAKEEKAKELEIIKAKTEKETVENYINNRLDLKMEIENIKMFIELSKEVKAQEEMKPAIQKRMYAFAAEVPYNIEVKFKNDQYELSFSNLDQVVEMIFGKEWVKETTPDNEVVGVIKESSLPNISKFIYDLDKDKGNSWSAQHYTEDGNGNKIIIVSRNGDSDNTAEDIKKAVEEKYPKLRGDITENKAGVWFYLTESQKLTEAYEQFNIGEIEVVFNPDTYETLYSIPSADVQDKKINLTKVPTVDTPYDTDTIIKSYIETRFGRIPTEEEKKVEDNNETLEPTPEKPEPSQEEEIPQDDINIDRPKEAPQDDLGEPENIDSDLIEDELPDEPEENETPAEIEEETPEAETGSATFMKIRPKQNISVEDLRAQQLDGNTPNSNYIVVDTIDLPAEEFEDLSNNLNQPRSYLEGIQAIDRKNYSFNVVKVISAKSSYDLLIDPLGYNYPRYVSVVDKASI